MNKERTAEYYIKRMDRRAEHFDLQKRGMRGSSSTGRGFMSRATSMYRMSLVNKSWLSRVTSWDCSTAVGIVEASLGMSESSRVGTQASASGVSGVSCKNERTFSMQTAMLSDHASLEESKD